MKFFKKRVKLLGEEERWLIDNLGKLDGFCKDEVVRLVKNFLEIEEKYKNIKHFEWNDTPLNARFPNLYAEIALHVCASPEGYAQMAGVTEEVLYNVVYLGTDNFSADEIQRLQQGVEARTGGRVTGRYLLAPSFSRYFLSNKKHNRKLFTYWCLFDGIRDFMTEKEQQAAPLFMRHDRWEDLQQHGWVSRAYVNKVTYDLERAEKDAEFAAWQRQQKATKLRSVALGHAV